VHDRLTVTHRESEREKEIDMMMFRKRKEKLASFCLKPTSACDP